MSIRLHCGQTISRDFKDALDRAEPKDLRVRTTEVSSHSEISERRVGYLPYEILGIAIPEFLRITYVKAIRDEAIDYYVVSQLKEDAGGPRSISFSAETEQEARAILLRELREYLERELPDARDRAMSKLIDSRPADS